MRLEEEAEKQCTCQDECWTAYSTDIAEM